MYVKQKRGNCRLKKCGYIHFFLPFRLFLYLFVSSMTLAINVLVASCISLTLFFRVHSKFSEASVTESIVKCKRKPWYYLPYSEKK